jgi:hypothetical protein
MKLHKDYVGYMVPGENLPIYSLDYSISKVRIIPSHKPISFSEGLCGVEVLRAGPHTIGASTCIYHIQH